MAHRSLRRAAALLAAIAVAGAAAAQPPHAALAPPDTLEQRLLACTACHRDQGRAGTDAYYPRIAGKPAGYLYNQLLNFREGRRHYPLMAGLLDPLPDAYLREIAQHFARLDLPYPPPAPPARPSAVLERGRELALRGDAGLDLPACSRCHGSDLTGAAPAIPGLLGLPRDYVNAQFGAWKTGLRRAEDPDCMARIAQRMSPDDVAAVSAWLAAQPVPRAPAKRQPSLAPPMRCGSVPESDAGVPLSAAWSAIGARASAGAATPAARQDAATRDASRQDAAARIARGRTLALAGNCAGCHTVRGGPEYAGGRGIETPFGTVRAPNITPDADTGIGLWSAADLRRALHEGRSRDGRLLYPAFPYPNYTLLRPEDVDDLYAYLRSLAPVRQANLPHALRFPFDRQFALAAWRALYFRPGSYREDPRRSAQWNRGAYLVRGLGHCDACHGGRNLLGASGGALAGGAIPMQGWYAPALAGPRPGDTGHAQDLVALLRTGMYSRGSAMGPMAEVIRRSTQHLDDADLAAIAEYLASLPPEAGAPGPRPAAQHSAQDAGARRLYEDRCADCHGARGEGVPGVYPALAGNASVLLESPSNAIRALLAGGFPPAAALQPRPYGMPPFAPFLNDRDAAAILSYVRGAWGNTAAPVTPAVVATHRGTRAD